MKKIKGTISLAKKAPSTSVRAVKEKADKARDTERVLERGIEATLIKAVEELSGVRVSVEEIKKILFNLNIDPTNKELTDDDLLLIYNIFSEPLVDKVNNQFTFDKVETEEDKNKYFEKVNQDSTLFKRVLPSNRVQAMYEFLPSLEMNRINFRIDKDIFRNKPLLGRGLYKCTRCGSDDTEDREKQTRSADEPMTVFVNCRNCGHKFKFN